MKIKNQTVITLKETFYYFHHAQLQFEIKFEDVS